MPSYHGLKPIQRGVLTGNADKRTNLSSILLWSASKVAVAMPRCRRWRKHALAMLNFNLKSPRYGNLNSNQSSREHRLLQPYRKDQTSPESGWHWIRHLLALAARGTGRGTDSPTSPLPCPLFFKMKARRAFSHHFSSFGMQLRPGVED